MAGSTMLEVIGELTADPSARAALQEDPDGFLLDRGLDGFTAEDLRDAIDHSADALPVDVAAHLTGPTAPGGLAGETDHDAVLRLLGHAAEAPLPEDTPEDGDFDMDPDMDFGAGSAAATADGAIEDSSDVELEDDEDEELDEGDDLEGQDPVSLVDDVDPASLVPALEEETPDLPEPEGLGEESEEAPGHWGDHHTDEGGLDPQDFGHDLGDLPHA
jgi:hypothetical protein